MYKTDQRKSQFSEIENLIGTKIDKMNLYGFTSEPVVYTTRLDEMCVFNMNMNSLDVEQLTKRIERESCPNLIVPKSPNHINKTNAESFTKLKNKIKQVNLKIKRESRKKNRQLSRMCKPVRVVLKDIKYTYEDDKTAIEQIDSETLSSDEELVPLPYIKPKSIILEKSHTTPSSHNSNRGRSATHLLQDNPMESSKAQVKDCNKTNSTLVTFQHGNKKKTFALSENQNIERYTREYSILRKHVKNMGISGFRQTYILIENWRTNITDVYHLNRYGNITQYYRSSNLKINKLGTIFPDFEEHVKISHCCWYQREECRKLLFINIPISVSNFLKKPHDCKAGECTCCCRTDTQLTGQTATPNNVSYIENISVKPVSQIAASTQNSQENLIPKLPESTDEWLRDLLNKKTTVPKTYGLIGRAMTYTPKLHLKEPAEILRKEGCLRFAKIIIRKQAQVPLSSDMNCSNDCYYVGPEGNLEIYCSLQNPQHLIDDLINPNILLQTPKKNEFDKAICCWYKREILTLGLRVKNMLPTAIKFIRTPHLCPVGECTCCCKPVINKKIILEDIDLPPVQIHTSDHVNKLTCFKMEINKGKRHVSGNVQSTKNISQDTAKVQTLINTIKKFCDIRLVVDAKGKLEAELITPVSLLSSPELKCLSSIISLAQKQIASLGLTPGKHFNLEINTSGQPSIKETVNDPKETKNNTAGSITKKQNVIRVGKKRKNDNKVNKLHSSSKLSTRSIIISSLSNLLSEKSQHGVEIFKSYFQQREISTRNYNTVVPSTYVTPKIINTFTVSSDRNLSEKACSTDSSITQWVRNPSTKKHKIMIETNLTGVKRKSTTRESNIKKKNRRSTSTKINISNNKSCESSVEVFQHKMAPINLNKTTIPQTSQLVQHVPVFVNQTNTQPFSLSNGVNIHTLQSGLHKKHSVNILRKQTKVQQAVDVDECRDIVQAPNINYTGKTSVTIPVPCLAQNYCLEVSNAQIDSNDQKRRADTEQLMEKKYPCALPTQPPENSMLLKLIKTSHVPPQIILTNINNHVGRTDSFSPTNYVVNSSIINEIPENIETSTDSLPADVIDPNVNLEASINLIGPLLSVDEDCILGV